MRTIIKIKGDNNMKTAIFQLRFSNILFALAFALIVLVAVNASAQYALTNYPETYSDFTEPVSSNEVNKGTTSASQFASFYTELAVDKESQMQFEDWMVDEKLEQSYFYLKNIEKDREKEMDIEKWMLDNLEIIKK